MACYLLSSYLLLFADFFGIMKHQKLDEGYFLFLLKKKILNSVQKFGIHFGLGAHKLHCVRFISEDGVQGVKLCLLIFSCFFLRSEFFHGRVYDYKTKYQSPCTEILFKNNSAAGVPVLEFILLRKTLSCKT